ncbi:MAG: YceD family protein [Alphaproteobacteria bacterium]
MATRKKAGGAETPPVLEMVRPLDGIPPSGHEVKVDLPAEDRALLAARYDLIEVPSMTVAATVQRTATGAHVVGEVNARVVAACVVTLAPVAQTISEHFDIEFVLEGVKRGDIEAPVLDEDEDPPEILTDGMIDLGGLFEEHFVLALEPYPRAEGAEIPEEFSSNGEPGGASAFAGLAALRDRQAGRKKPETSEH